MTTLHAPVVRLSDLFDDAGANADRVLGPGPGAGRPHRRGGARSLRAIARQFGVDWRPVSPADRAVLERPGRPLRRDDVLEAVRSALVAGGASGDCDIELPASRRRWCRRMPIRGRSCPTLDYDASAGRFTRGAVGAGEGMEPIHLRVAGRVR